MAKQALLLVRGEQVMNIIKVPANEVEQFRRAKAKEGIFTYSIPNDDIDQEVLTPRVTINGRITKAQFEKDIAENENHNEVEHFIDTILHVAGLASPKLTTLQVVYLLRDAADRIAAET